jgi:transcriptional regulator with XRE-family HTH domain
MNFGQQVTLWRAEKGWGQGELSARAGVSRAYLSRMESNRVDPSLSVLRRLAAALEISVGGLLEKAPSRPALDRHQLDRLARSVFHPHSAEYRDLPQARILADAFAGRREALGLSRPRKNAGKANPRGKFALRRLRAEWGEETWKALLRRIDKHAPFYARPAS